MKLVFAARFLNFFSPVGESLAPIRLFRPFHPLALQLLLAGHGGQVELVFPGVDFGVFGQGDFNQRLVLFLAQHDAEAKRADKIFDAGFESI